MVFWQMLNRSDERRKRLFIILLFIFFVSGATAQEKSDSTVAKITIEKSPSGAMLRSALVPGWGQLYNDQKLKALLVAAGEMALIGNAIYYNQLAVKSQTENERGFYQDLRGQFLWWLLGLHLLSVLDAYVDAHLWDFDTGPDLSLNTIHDGCRGMVLSLRFTL